MSNIYILDEKIRENIKIGSSIDFINRMAHYVTSSDNFDNNSHNIYNYEIIDATINNIKLNCYQIDKLIQLCSKELNIPFIKYNGTGGIEFYKRDNYSNLNNFFDKLNIKYICNKIDVDNLQNSIKMNNINLETKNNILISKDILNYVLTKLNNKEEFKLKPYQQKISDIVNKYNERLQHLIIAPTGTGKTVIFTKIICDNINKNKDIIIISKRKDILFNLDTRIDNYIDKFIDNNITNINKNNYKIVKCTNNCNLDILNEKSLIPQIYIINWDKLTSSEKSDYIKIKWDKFGLLIIDESHWCGADNIYDIMKHIKNNTKLNYLGFSATPVRCDKTKQINTLDIFGNNEDYNIIYEYSYYEALKNKDICPIKYYPIFISEKDINLIPEVYKGITNNKNENDTNNDNINNDKEEITKKLKKTSYLKVWNNINNDILNKLHFKKGIIWFRNRTELFEFYNKIKEHEHTKNFKIFISVTTNNKDTDILKKLIKTSKLDNNHYENAISNFLKEDKNAILFAVHRATEGFDDDKLDFAIRLYYSNNIDPLNEMQKMGRLNRFYKNKPCPEKECAYFLSLELNDDTEVLKQHLLKRLKSWIEFIKDLNKSSENKDLQEEKAELIKLLEIYSDILIKDITEIDIEKDIVNDLMVIDKNYIRNFVRSENNKRYIQKKDLLDTSKKIKKYIEDNKLIVPDNINNWLQYGFNDKIYKELITKYYYNKDIFIEACRRININNTIDYKNKYKKDNKLPPYEYINSGFYYDLDPKFNLQLLLNNNNYEF